MAILIILGEMLYLKMLSPSTRTLESRMRIKFVGEKAVDTGGVCRDMFSAFWDIAIVGEARVALFSDDRVAKLI